MQWTALSALLKQPVWKEQIELISSFLYAPYELHM
jgi:hypothetical protein